MFPVTVLLPVYNAQHYLGSALESVLCQTFPTFEVIAVDDGSTDSSPRILEMFSRKDSRVRVITRAQSGIVGALNEGLNASTGELVARMDADDVADPGRLAAQVDFMAAHPRCVAVGTDVLFTDPEGSPLIRHRPANTHEMIVRQLLEGNGGALIHPSVMFRREAMNRAGKYRDRYQWIEDLDIYLRLSEVGELANLSDVYLYYRQHLKSVNRTQAKREDLRRELLEVHRKRAGLPALADATYEPTSPSSRSEWRRHWAYDAARGNHWQTARKNASRALLLGPFDQNNWRCLRYVIGAAPRNKERLRTVALTLQ